MAGRTFAFKVLSLLVIFVFLFSNAAVARAQQPDPGTATPPAPSATPGIPASLEAPAEATPTAAPTQAPTVFTISGKVTGKDGLPLAGVSISDDHGNSVATTADGSYALPGLKPGTYLVTPKLEGQVLIPYYRVVKLVDKDVSGIDFYPPKSNVDVGKAHATPPAGSPPEESHPPAGQSVQAPNPPEGNLSSQAVYTLGAPGLSYRYASQIGITEQPYLVDPLDSITHLNGPSGIALDLSGDLLEVEEKGSRLVRFTPSGVSNLSIGVSGVESTDNYSFYTPDDTAEKPDDSSIWVGDNSRIVKYDASGNFVLQFPSGDPYDTGSDNGHFSDVRSLAFKPDSSEIYVADRHNNRVQVFTFASRDAPPVYARTIGESGVWGSDNSHFSEPWHITYYAGYLYVADMDNQRIMKCDPESATTSCSVFFGQTGQEGSDMTHLSYPSSIAFGTIGSTDHAFIADAGNLRVLKCAADGSSCAHFAGTAGEDGTDNNHFAWPADIAVGATDGKVYVADRDNARIQIFNGDSGDWIGQRGTTDVPYLTDSDHLYGPDGIVMAPDGSLYVMEVLGYTLVKYNSSGVFQWRKGQPGVPGWDIDHFGDFGGNQLTLGVDSAGRIYVPDSNNDRIIIYLPDGSVFNTFGNYGTGNDQFACPTGVAIRPGNGDIYIEDHCNMRVQVYNNQWHYKGTIGETNVSGSDSDHFNYPNGLAVDANGNVYVADNNNDRVQKCKLTGTGYTCVPFAGVTGMGGRDFRFNEGANDVTIGPDGLIYVVEVAGNDRVQVYDPSGAYRTSMGGNWGSGTGTMRNPDSAIVDGNNNVYVTDQWNGRVVIFARGVPGWSQLNVNGWGEYLNFVNSLAEFNGKLYAGVYNDTGSGSPAKIYRYNDDGTWTGVVMDGFGDSSNIGIDALISISGYLYAGVWHNGTGAQIWRSNDGVTWTQVSLPHDLSSANSKAYLFEEFSSDLYVAPYDDSHAAQIWRCHPNTPTSCDGADDWVQVNDTGFVEGSANAAVSSFAVAGGYLVAGTSNNDSGGQIWASSSSDAGSWAPVESNGFGDSHNSVVSSLEVFGGYLYAGTTNSITGAQVWRCQISPPCSSWTEVVSDGFGSADNSSIPVLKLFNNQLYAFTDNQNQGMQVFETSDSLNGLLWSSVINGVQSGFGSNLRDSIYSPAAAVVHKLRLMVGVNNHYNSYGGQVWASDPAETYTIHGTITSTSGPLPDSITLTLQPGATTTILDVSGGFSFSALPQGNYTITPTRAGCTFTPTFWQNSITDNVYNANFSVTCAEPTLLSPADGTQLNSLLPLTLSWSTLSGATKYNLVVSTSVTFASTFKSVTQASTSYALSGMAAGVTYYWRVKESSPLAGAWSVTWKFYAPKPPAAPVQLQPANNAVLAAGNFQPVFTWKAAVVATGANPVQHYHLQVSRSNTFASLDLDEYTPDASTSYTTPFYLTPNRVFYWRIRAFNTSGGYSAWSSVRSFKTLPGDVGLDWIENQDTLQPTFHWHDDWNTSKYTIQICKRSGSTCSSFKSATVTGLSYSLTSSLATNTLYQWRVQAIGMAGAGAWTSYASWTSPVPPAVPALATPLANEVIPDTANPGYQMTFTWKSVKTATSGAITYQLQVSWQTDFDPDYTWSQDITDSTPGGVIVSYSSSPDQAIWSNSTNYWRMRACASDGCSRWTSARKLLGMPATPAYVGEGPLNNTGVYAFQWTDYNSNAANTYNIQVCNNATCSSKFKSATVSSGWEYDLMLPSNKAMYWRVQGVGVTTGGWMPTHAFHTVVTPGVPSLLSPASNAVLPAPIGINFSWNPVTGADGYEIQISTSSAFDNMTDPSSIDQTPSGASTTSATADWSYGTGYWRVRAQVAGYWGQWSAGRKFITKPYMHGFVYDLDGNPLSGAAVNLTGGYSTTTNSGGEYWLPANLPTGTKILTVTDSPNFLPMTRSLSLANGGNYYFTNVWLAPVNSTSTDYRFVLSWADPTYRDMDLHAWLPAATPEHIFYQNNGLLTAFPFARLTVNDITPDVEVLDVRQFQTGKTVVAVNQYYPFSGSWSATNVKVEVYQGTTPVWSCTSPGGSGHWWYVMDVSVASPGATPTFTCKNKNQSKAPAPYTDNNISGAITQTNGRPAQGVTMDYGVGAMTVDSPYTLTGLGPGTYNLTPNKGGTHWTFNPTSYLGVAIGTTDNNFTAIPDSSVTQGGAPAAVAVQGDYLYVGGGGKLYVLNVQDKTSIIQATTYWISTDAITDVVVQGDYAYVVEGYSGLNILDISNPSTPQFVGLYADGLEYKSVAISGHYAYLTSGTDLVVVDIQDPAKPTFVVDDYWSGNAANRVMIDGDYAYMVGEQGLWVLDISDPTNPAIASTWESASGNPVVDVAMYDGDLILTETAGLYVLNDDDPTNLYQVLSVDLPGGAAAYRSTPVFDVLVVADGANGLLTYDLSKLPNIMPQLGAFAPTSVSVTAVAEEDAYAYIVNGASVQIVNVIDPTTPVLVGSLTPVP
ncbi:MAG: carboxypeptidase regulatory-like domain-containing protein [Anaerolineaceae bacterium]